MESETKTEKEQLGRNSVARPWAVTDCMSSGVAPAGTSNASFTNSYQQQQWWRQPKRLQHTKKNKEAAWHCHRVFFSVWFLVV